MARRTAPTPTPAVQRSADLSFDDLKRAIPRLQRRIEEVEALDPTTVSDVQAVIATLRTSIEDALGRTFGHDTVEYARYEPAARFGDALLYAFTQQNIVDGLLRHKAKSLALLKQAVSSLEERLGEVGVPILGRLSEMPDEVSRKVFVVHGQDTGAREAVARFLERTGFEPIVLHEQANQGRTIIEKFEEHSAVGFAVVLLTPDDMGGIAGGAMHPRARQNVILELGYFIGRLGRDKVCALKSGDIELPSDIFGVVWTAFDAGGGWKVSLAKELQAAGFEIDWNKVMA